MDKLAPFIIAVLVFSTVIVLGIWLFYFVTYRKERRKMVDRLQGYEIEAFDETEVMQEAPEKGLSGALYGMVISIGNALKPKQKKEYTSLRLRLIRAGTRRDSAPVLFHGIKALCALGSLACFIFIKLLFMKTLAGTQFFTLLVLSAAWGYYVPDIYLRIVTNRRRRAISESFPDAIDLMVICVEAGMGLDSAINRVGEEIRLTSPPLADEFRQLSLELRAGKLRREALRNFAMRIGIDDVYSLVTLLIQTDRFGTKISQALRVYSDSMRTKRQQRAEELASKLPVKLVFPLILFIFPALFVTILGPAMIQVYRTFVK